MVIGRPFSLSGGGFRGYGYTEASGSGTSNSASNIPVVQLISLGNEQTLWLPLSAFSDSSLTAQPVSVGSFPMYYTRLTVFVNGIPSQSRIVRISYQSIFSPLIMK
jgi:hypothetical protein